MHVRLHFYTFRSSKSHSLSLGYPVFSKQQFYEFSSSVAA